MRHQPLCIPLFSSVDSLWKEPLSELQHASSQQNNRLRKINPKLGNSKRLPCDSWTGEYKLQCRRFVFLCLPCNSSSSPQTTGHAPGVGMRLESKVDAVCLNGEGWAQDLSHSHSFIRWFGVLFLWKIKGGVNNTEWVKCGLLWWYRRLKMILKPGALP